jgi:Flp pilus assembly pilin Flp
MKNMMKAFVADEQGFVVSAELVLVSTVAVIGLLVGLSAVRDGVVSELSDVAGAVQDANQSFSLDGVVGHNANTAGFDFEDNLDECDSTNQTSGASDNCVTFGGLIAEEGTFGVSRNTPNT